MSKKSKLELLMELSDKMFNNKLSQVQAKLAGATAKMQAKLDTLVLKNLDTKNVDKLSSLQIGIGAGLASEAVQMVTTGISELSTEAVRSVDALTKFEDTMNFAGFKTNEIQLAKDAVKQYASDTVYDLTTTANTVAQLAANGVKDYTGLTMAAGNLNAVAGGNAETFKSVAMVLTQTAGAGKLTTENWNQLANAIPGASGKLQEALRANGAFTGNFRDAMEDGKISALEFNKALMDLGMDPIAVEAAKSTKTFEGAIGQLKANVVDTFANILQAIGIENLTTAINMLGTVIQTALQPFTLFFKELKEGNPQLEVMLAIIGALTVGIAAYKIVVGTITLITKAWADAQAFLNTMMAANPIGLIVGAIAALVALVAVAITKWDEWGAALMIFLGPIGVMISMFKSIYDHWESIKKAFETEGIIGGFKRLGAVILDALLKPIQQLLELLAELPLIGGLFGAGANFIKDLRTDMDTLSEGEKAKLGGTGDAMVGLGLAKPVNLFETQPLIKTPTTASKPTDTKKQGERVSKVAGQANQVRKVDIKIDAFNKGGINVAQKEFQGMSKADVEAFFKEMLRRVIANAEIA